MPTAPVNHRWRSFLWTHENTYMLTLAVLTGLLGGYGAVGFRFLIRAFRSLCYGPGDDFIQAVLAHDWLYRILIPALVGLVVGPMIYFLAREAKGHGVPEVMDAVALKGGIIRKRVVVIKSLASALSIAAGGSVGREGPIVQIGSAIGSTLGQILGVSPGRMRVLVGCGAAAGIAATFNAPVAGMMFALEIILGEFAISTFSPIVISAVMATAISRYHLGNFPAFIVPQYHLVSYYELGLYAALGLAAGGVAALFTTTLYKVEDLFGAWKFPDYLKTPLSAAGIGAFGLAFPWILGVGYEGIDLALADKLSWYVLLALVGAKILATSVTIGGGMSGGVFAPSLFLGAMLGGAFGHLVHSLLPGLTASPGAYALVAMGAVVAGTTHGPLSAFLILFEMSADYHIILPLMIACILGTLTAAKIKKESIYTLKLLRRGVDIKAGKELNLLRALKVKDVMSRGVETVPEEMALDRFMELVVHSKHRSFPVVNHQGELTGIISHADYAEVVFDESLHKIVVVKDMATTRLATITPEDDLELALARISRHDYNTLPVVAEPGSRKLVGIISQRDIVSAYSRQVLKSSLAPSPGRVA